MSMSHSVSVAFVSVILPVWVILFWLGNNPAVFLDEPFTPRILAGSVLVLAGVAVAVQFGRQPAKK